MLNAQEKSGLTLFMEKGCVACHNGVNVGGQGYFPFGVVENPGAEVLPPDDKGRFNVRRTSDEYVFATWHCALRTFTRAKVWNLKQAVGVMGSSQLGAKLTDTEEDDIVAFLGALTGQLPNVQYPILPTRTDSTPEPSLVK